MSQFEPVHPNPLFVATPLLHEVKSAKSCFVGYPVNFLTLAGSLLSWNVFPNFIETVFHLE